MQRSFKAWRVTFKGLKYIATNIIIFLFQNLDLHKKISNRLELEQVQVESATTEVPKQLKFDEIFKM